MCGIVGVADGRGRIDLELLRRQSESLRHRGPDACGEVVLADGRVAMASRRLAIRDLSAAGHMPMSTDAGDITVVFNGEIYNTTMLRGELEEAGYSFRSTGDTEVLLAAYSRWGVDCLARLNGMFAFVICDERRRAEGSGAGPVLFAARDRAGEKPFFFRLKEGRFSFASELRALLLDPHEPRHLNAEALQLYLALGYVPGEHCLVSGIGKLPAGSYLLFDVETGSLERQRYWALPEPPASSGAETSELVDELEETLRASVRERLVADVPLGVLLSGGLDSSLVTAFAAEHVDRLRTFTISVPGTPRFDESAHALRIARHYGTDHTILEASPDSGCIEDFAAAFDEPLGDSSLIPTSLVSRLTRQHVTVALGGDGGDELFGGYTRYLRAKRFAAVHRAIPRALLSSVEAVGNMLPTGFRGRSALRALSVDPTDAVLRQTTYFDAADRKRILTPALSAQCRAGITPETFRRQHLGASPDIVEMSTRLDFATYLPDDILLKTDRASMAASLELRSPMLDHRVIAFAFGRLTHHHKVRRGRGKWLLKELGKRVLPPDFDAHRKQGFSIPVDQWLGGAWGDRLVDVLRGADPAVFQPDGIANMIDWHKRGARNGSRLFALAMFELWRTKFDVGLE